MRHKLALTTPILAAVMLLAVAVPALAAVNWQITLKHTAAFPRATGQAQYQSQPGQRELQIEAEHLRALAGKRVRLLRQGLEARQRHRHQPRHRPDRPQHRTRPDRPQDRPRIARLRPHRQPAP